MTTEMTMLAWAIVLGLIHAVATGQVVTAQHGIAYGLGPRDEQRPLGLKAARLQRAFANYLQSFPFFAAAVLIAQATGRHSWLTVWGADLFFWARLVYVPLYVFGVSGVRSVAFGVGFVGTAMILVALT